MTMRPLQSMPVPREGVFCGVGASAGGADIAKGALRVTFWGALAMAATAAVGMIFGVAA